MCRGSPSTAFASPLCSEYTRSCLNLEGNSRQANVIRCDGATLITRLSRHCGHLGGSVWRRRGLRMQACAHAPTAMGRAERSRTGAALSPSCHGGAMPTTLRPPTCPHPHPPHSRLVSSDATPTLPPQSRKAKAIYMLCCTEPALPEDTYRGLLTDVNEDR